MAIFDQEKVAERKDVTAFGALDHAFRKTHCDIAQAGIAFDAVITETSEVDRLRRLSPDERKSLRYFCPKFLPLHILGFRQFETRRNFKS